MQLFILILELVGTVAFAVSGAMIALKKKMDIFGVVLLGLITAVGGGVLRDIILGLTPPMTFTDPRYALCATATSLAVFVLAAGGRLTSHHLLYERVLLVIDSVGLGIFSASGVIIAVDAGSGDNLFLLLFVGAVTGVGGGVMRDLLAGSMPLILVRHIYAVASLCGAALCIVMLKLGMPRASAMLAATLAVVVIRLLSAHYRLNLPHCREDIE